MMRLAADGIERLEPVIASLLTDEEPFVRAEAISVLLGWWRKDSYLERGIEMLRTDPVYRVRSDAAFALGSFIAREPYLPLASPAHRERAIAELIRGLLEDEDVYVQETCYEQLHKILTGRGAALPERFNRETDVDWALLRPYVGEFPIPPQALRPPRISTDADVETLEDEGAEPEARAEALARLAADRRYEVGWEVGKLLDHDSPVLRGRALLELIRTWRYTEFPMARDMLQTDPDWEARAAAAEALPHLLDPFPWMREQLIEILVDALVRENDPRADEAIRRAIERLKQDPAVGDASPSAE